jgi:hypothetical protein
MCVRLVLVLNLEIWSTYHSRFLAELWINFCRVVSMVELRIKEHQDA